MADVAVGVTSAAGGLVAWRRNRGVGGLLLAVSATWFLGYLSHPLLYLHRGPMVHLHLSYPTGTLRRWTTRAVVAGGYAWAVIDGWVDQPRLTAAVAVAVSVAALDTFVRTSGPARRAGVPALVAALLFAAVLGLSAANQLLRWDQDLVVALVYDGVIAIVTTWLAADLIVGRWTEATVAHLVAQLGETNDAEGLVSALRRALGDPGLEVARPDSIAVPDGRSRTPVVDDGETVAVLVHHASVPDPELLRGAVEATRLAVLNSRLRADAARRADVLDGARRRLVEVDAEQRRMLGQAIASGPIAELRAARRKVQGAGMREGIDQAIAQLEDSAAGLRPPLDLGLEVALRRIEGPVPVVHRITVPDLPRTVAETIWFICAEARTNVAKHASASRIDIRVWQVGHTVSVSIADDGRGGADPTGSGLRGLADRVAAVGGSFSLQSPPGRGTTITARIPGEEVRVGDENP